MKKFGFIKKVTAAATAAAMVASLGISAFATTPGTAGSDDLAGATINITNVDLDQIGNSDVYKVTVSYKTTATNNSIGMTMLTYKQSDNTKDLTLGTSYDDSKVSEGSDVSKMQIIGIDQTNPVNAGDENNGQGTFEFNVTTDSSAAGGYYLKKGVTALIALSSDGNVNGENSSPAFATLTIPVSASSASNVTISSLVLDANEDIESKVVEEVQKQTVTLYDGETVAAENVSLASAEKVGSVTINGNVYTGNVKLTSATGVNIGSDGILVPFEVTVSLNPVAAAEISKVDGKAAETDGSFAVKIEKGDAASVADITAKLKEKTADIVDSTEKITGKVALNDTNAEVSTVDSTFDAAAETQVFTYTVTIKENATVTGTDYLNVTTPLTATVKVTVSSAPVGVTYILGDVNGDGKVDAMDWGILRNHVQKVVVNADLDDTTSRAYKAADVDKSGGKLSASDWGILRNHVQKVLINENIGKNYTD